MATGPAFYCDCNPRSKFTVHLIERATDSLKSQQLILVALPKKSARFRKRDPTERSLDVDRPRQFVLSRKYKWPVDAGWLAGISEWLRPGSSLGLHAEWERMLGNAPGSCSSRPPIRRPLSEGSKVKLYTHPSIYNRCLYEIIFFRSNCEIKILHCVRARSRFVNKLTWQENGVDN